MVVEQFIIFKTSVVRLSVNCFVRDACRFILDMRFSQW
jgi:hypothetical protein